MELIDKEKVIAEIERQIKEYSKSKVEYPDCEYYEGAVDVLETFRDEFLNTLEVKDVDLVEELGNYIKHYRNRETGYTMLGVARHFFKLGLKYKK